MHSARNHTERITTLHERASVRRRIRAHTCTRRSLQNSRRRRRANSSRGREAAPPAPHRDDALNARGNHHAGKASLAVVTAVGSHSASVSSRFLLTVDVAADDEQRGEEESDSAHREEHLSRLQRREVEAEAFCRRTRPLRDGQRTAITSRSDDVRSGSRQSIGQSISQSISQSINQSIN